MEGGGVKRGTGEFEEGKKQKGEVEEKGEEEAEEEAQLLVLSLTVWPPLTSEALDMSRRRCGGSERRVQPRQRERSIYKRRYFWKVGQ